MCSTFPAKSTSAHLITSSIIWPSHLHFNTEGKCFDFSIPQSRIARQTHSLRQKFRKFETVLLCALSWNAEIFDWSTSKDSLRSFPSPLPPSSAPSTPFPAGKFKLAALVNTSYLLFSNCYSALSIILKIIAFHSSSFFHRNKVLNVEFVYATFYASQCIQQLIWTKQR